MKYISPSLSSRSLVFDEFPHFAQFSDVSSAFGRWGTSFSTQPPQLKPNVWKKKNFFQSKPWEVFLLPISLLWATIHHNVRFLVHSLKYVCIYIFVQKWNYTIQSQSIIEWSLFDLKQHQQNDTEKCIWTILVECICPKNPVASICWYLWGHSCFPPLNKCEDFARSRFTCKGNIKLDLEKCK